MTRYLLGIAGAPGSGKSSLATQVVDALGASAVLLPMDGFHLPQARLRELGRRDRMGAPDTFDVDAFVATLARAHNSGNFVSAPGFDREIEEPVPDAIRILPELCTVVVVEGNYLLHDSGGWERVAPLLDATLFIELDPEVRRRRLVARHERFGKNHSDGVAWATGPDEANARIIEPGASRADAIIRLG